MAPNSPVTRWHSLNDQDIRGQDIRGQNSRRQDSRSQDSRGQDQQGQGNRGQSVPNEGTRGRTRAPRGGEWQALKSDLIALLEQVEERRETGLETETRGETNGVRDGGGEAETISAARRRQAALKSVSEAVDRFSHSDQQRPGQRGPSGRQLPPNPQDDLQSAIAQIRAQMQHHAKQLPEARPHVAGTLSHGALANAPFSTHAQHRSGPGEAPFFGNAPQPDFPKRNSTQRDQPERGMPMAAFANEDLGEIKTRFEDLSRLIGGLTERLEHIERDAHAARSEDAANVQEISAQVSQLGEVVELLAGAVGETGQVNRLESQIAALADTISHARNGDIETLGARIDDIALTVERLTDLQVQQMGRQAESTETGERQQSQTLAAIEASVRAIYERVDAIEQNTLLSPDDLDRLTGDLAEIARAFRDGAPGDVSADLFARIEALSQQIDKMQGVGSAQLASEMQRSVAVLRQGLIDSTEPRFDAIEQRIELLSGQLADSRHQEDTHSGLAQVRAQIEQLARRMDETGTQLAHLSSQYANQPEPAAPDFEELAKLVAHRTSQEIARNIGHENGLSAQSLADLESRLSALFESKAPQKKQEEIRSLHRGIASVEDKISRLEAALAQSGNKNVGPGAAKALGMSQPSGLGLEPMHDIAPAVEPEGWSAPQAGRDAAAKSAPENSELANSGLANSGPANSASKNSAKTHSTAEPTPKPAPKSTANSAPAPASDKRMQPAPAPRPGQSDAMPHDPLAETPLIDAGPAQFTHRDTARGFEDGAPLRTNLGHTGLRDMAARARAEPATGEVSSAAAKGIDPDTFERPAKPHSRLFGLTEEASSPPATEAKSAQKPPTHGGERAEPQLSSSDPDAPKFAEPSRAEPPHIESPRAEQPPRVEPKFAAAPTPASAAEGRADRNTFIAAARRAAMQSEAAQKQTESQSLIARAFGRLQGGDGPEASPATNRFEDEGAGSRDARDNKGRAEDHAFTQTGPTNQTSGATSRLAVGRERLTNWLARVRDKTAAQETAADVDETVVPVQQAAKVKPAKKKKPRPAKRPNRKNGPPIADVAAIPDPLSATEAPNEAKDKTGLAGTSRRTLLLAALVVATSVLTLNLVVRRIGEQTPPNAALATPAAPVKPLGASPSTNQGASSAAPAASSSAPAGFNPAPMLDPQPTGSIDPQMRIQLPQSDARTGEPAQPMPAPAEGAPRQVGLASVPGNTAIPQNGTLDPQASPSPNSASGAVKLDLPPKELGPLALRQAAADGDARAQFEIGAIYTEGTVAGKDLKLAAVWYERAAAQGFAPAQYRLGNLYEHGQGVDKDLELAKLWYMRSAEAGNRMAMHNLASLLAGGALGQPQFPAAVEWFTQAAARGMTDSQFNLGMLYARGLGVTQDMGQSYKWFSLAARDGDKDAAKARDDIARSLDPDTLKKVKVELANWRLAPIDMAANFAPIGTWANNFDPGRPITEAKVIKRVQLALERIGFDVGSPDGVMGPKTAQAIKKFETETGMAPSGVVNPRLLAVLGSQPV